MTIPATLLCQTVALLLLLLLFNTNPYFICYNMHNIHISLAGISGRF